MLRLTLDLTRRRPAEVCAAEVVKDAATPPMPGTEAWWIAIREAVYATREGLIQARRRPSTGRVC